MPEQPSMKQEYIKSYPVVAKSES